MKVEFELEDSLVDECGALWGRMQVGEVARRMILRAIGAARLRREVADFERTRAADIDRALGLDRVNE